MEPIEIRAARASDVPAITACVCEAYVHYIERIGKRPAPMLEDFGQTLAASQVHVATDGRSVLGVIVLQPTADGLYVDNVAVRPAHKGQGIGRRLLAFAESEALRQGYSTIYLATHELMTENQSLYRRIGYVLYERRVVNGYPRVFMRKPPGPHTFAREFAHDATLTSPNPPAGATEMGDDITIYHNPGCGTSRNVLALIRSTGAQPRVVEYLKTPPGRDEIRRLVAAMGMSSVRQVLRRRGTPYDELKLDDPKWTDEQLLDFIAQHPILLERPIVVTPKGTRMCRPSEAVVEILPDGLAQDFVKEDGEVVKASKPAA